VEDPADHLLMSLFNTSGHLVKAHAEIILELLNALLGEEGSECSWGGGNAKQRGLWGIKPWEDGKLPFILSHFRD
jgi:hypothetical protein